MNLFKSHFWYNKNQRNGIFLLAIIILILQSIYFFVDFSSSEFVHTNDPKLLAFQKQIDSLEAIEFERKKPKIYPFNPNYITDFKGYQLGMSTDEIDRLFAFRKKNRFINSKKEFQKVTKISDSLLDKISPYFKFPNWVVKRNQQLQKQIRKQYTTLNVEKSYINTHKVSTNNINKATILDLQSINGIGDKLSKRIIKYRNKLQGFSFEDQLYEVWGLDAQTANSVLSVFKIVEKPNIKKINVNTATFREVLKNPYINYKLCKSIFEYRDEVAEFQKISELKNIKGFPLDKYDRIVLYLIAE